MSGSSRETNVSLNHTLFLEVSEERAILKMCWEE